MFPSSFVPPHMDICIEIKGNVFCVCRQLIAIHLVKSANKMLINFKALLWLARNRSYRLGSKRCSSLQLWKMMSGLRVVSPQSTCSWVKEKISVTSNFPYRLGVRCEMAAQKGQCDRDLRFPSAKRRLALLWHLVSQKKLITAFFCVAGLHCFEKKQKLLWAVWIAETTSPTEITANSS